ncbi:unnamed protein product [Eruca vesicaria subsp. sativa]|uniref:Peptidase A1 domain-containing protein n=1 Tax=Eruca vesicaria subsp. sativa TaxID=29727 RepID=A0ABC8JCW5_ERUVS|nr:unnamed protein product [Eruca vesicaria subsp. sativa]
MVHLMVFLSMFATITLTSEAQYVLPITKDEPTKQLYTTLNAPSPVNLLLDLKTDLTWLNCRKLKPSPTLRLVSCQSSTCKSLHGNGCDGKTKTCLYRQPTPLGITPVLTTGRVVQDRATFSKASLSHFTFSCAEEKHFQGFSPQVAGVLGLSPGQFSFWRQVTTAFNIIPKFSLCLPSSGNGHLYIGGAKGGNNKVPMTLTPLKNIGYGDYLLSVKSFYVGGSPLSLNPSLLEAGAKLSTVVPYTVLHTDIYNALARSFTQKATKIGMFEAPGHEPFTDCFDEGASTRNQRGLKNVPVIEIGLPGRAGEVKWSFHGENTVVRVLETVICLAFIDGGKQLKESVIIGTHQLQDYMIDFDFSTTRMAFSDSLLLHNTSCSTRHSHKATSLYYTNLNLGNINHSPLLLGTDSVSLLTSKPNAVNNSVHSPLTLSCPINVYTLRLMPKIVNGTIGLGNSSMSLLYQLASMHENRRKLSLCLPSKPAGLGSLHIGGVSPYTNYISKNIASTPLVVDQTTGGYFIDVMSIEIAGNVVTFGMKRRGNAMICTLAPYTVLQGTIYKALVRYFAREAKMLRVANVKPFDACFSSKGMGVKAVVPVIDLVVKGGAKWRINRWNSLVKVKRDVVCLGFLNGGVTMKTIEMVIGGFQMEDHIVELDLEASKFSFSSSLLFNNTSCGKTELSKF